jgi:prepilin-type N-terminal cleavage/methylation domain-containing protein
MRTLGSRRGFSLIEIVVALAVLATIAALVVPTLAGLIRTDKERATQRQVERVWRAIFGNPANGEFGYVGDMGRLPTSLSELVDQGTQIAFHTADGATEHVGRIGTGWRGPYLKDWFSTTDLLADAWGQALTFTNGQVVSAGPDGSVSTTGDNIVFPVSAPLTTGNLFVDVVTNRIPTALGSTVKLYSPVNGEQTAGTTKKFLPGDTTFDGFFFENLTPGLYVLVVANTGQNTTVTPNTCVTVSRIVTVAVLAGQQVLKEVRMLTAADVLVSNDPCPIPD